MYCQVCGAPNRDDHEFCVRCHQKLLVLSGSLREEEEAYEEGGEESFSFDEHLLERISILEEAVKRTAETVRQLLGALHKQEKNILINQTGLSALRELLETKKYIGWDEWSELWESKMDYQLLALEKRERFLATKERIAGLYHGDKRKLFLQYLEDAEYALFAFDIERAVGALEAAYKLDRGNYELAYFLGETHFNEANSEAALGYFARVLEVKPDHYEGLVYSGVIHYERGDHARAEEHLKRAVAIYPDSFLPHFSLGAVYAGKGDLAKAVLFLERAVEVDPVPQALFLLGSCYYEMGKLSSAVHYLQEAVRHDPAFEEAHHLLGLAYLDRHWTRKALDAFRQAQRLNPKRLQYQDLVSYLSGHHGAPLPQVDGEAASLVPQGGGLPRARQPEAGPLLLPARPGARSREPDPADVLRPALPEHEPQSGDRGGDAQGAGPQPRRDPQGHRLRGDDRGDAQPGEAPRGEPHRRAAARRGELELHQVDRLLRDGLQPGGDGGGPRRGPRLRQAVGRAGAGRDQAVPARRPRLGALQAQGVRQGGRLPVAVERAGALAHHAHPSRDGPPGVRRGGPGALRARPRPRPRREGRGARRKR